MAQDKNSKKESIPGVGRRTFKQSLKEVLHPKGSGKGLKELIKKYPKEYRREQMRMHNQKVKYEARLERMRPTPDNVLEFKSGQRASAKASAPRGPIPESLKPPTLRGGLASALVSKIGAKVVGAAAGLAYPTKMGDAELSPAMEKKKKAFNEAVKNKQKNKGK